MDDTLIIALLKWIGAGVLATIGWIGKGMWTDVKELKKDSSDCALRLEMFKTHVSEHYAKDASVQQSLARIHDRMDSGFKEIREALRK